MMNSKPIERLRSMTMYYGTNRYVCDALAEMRKALKALGDGYVGQAQLTTYKAHTSSLVEEMQTMVNRMEAALRDHDDYEMMMRDAKKLKKEIKALKKEKRGLINE